MDGGRNEWMQRTKVMNERYTEKDDCDTASNNFVILVESSSIYYTLFFCLHWEAVKYLLLFIFISFLDNSLFCVSVQTRVLGILYCACDVKSINSKKFPRQWNAKIEKRVWGKLQLIVWKLFKVDKFRCENISHL